MKDLKNFIAVGLLGFGSFFVGGCGTPPRPVFSKEVSFELYNYDGKIVDIRTTEEIDLQGYATFGSVTLGSSSELSYSGRKIENFVHNRDMVSKSRRNDLITSGEYEVILRIEGVILGRKKVLITKEE